MQTGIVKARSKNNEWLNYKQIECSILWVHVRYLAQQQFEVYLESPIRFSKMCRPLPWTFSSYTTHGILGQTGLDRVSSSPESSACLLRCIRDGLLQKLHVDTQVFEQECCSVFHQASRHTWLDAWSDDALPKLPQPPLSWSCLLPCGPILL